MRLLAAGCAVLAALSFAKTADAAQEPLPMTAYQENLSDAARAFLDGNPASGWLTPTGYGPVFASISDLVRDGKPGAAAKTANQLAAIYTRAGRLTEAAVFREVTAVITAAHALREVDAPADTQILLPGRYGFTIALTREARQAVRAMQRACGTGADGIIGWRTLGCLPGGSGYVLPQVIRKAGPLPATGEITR